MTNADRPDMYAEEVFGKNFTASAEGLPEGKYTVEIYLAETYHHAAGKRVFSILAGQKVLAKDLDLFAEAGFSCEVVIRGEVFHQSDNINGPLALRFDAKHDFTKFNAIQILSDDEAIVACVKANELKRHLPVWATKIPDVKDPVIYTDTRLPVEQRVADLVRRMSLAEKVSQLRNSTQAIPRLGVPAYDYWNECLHGVARRRHRNRFSASHWNGRHVGYRDDALRC